METVFKFAETAFNDAIRRGLLSVNPLDQNFVGNYMYMGTPAVGTLAGDDQFKNIHTRHYLPTNK